MSRSGYTDEGDYDLTNLWRGMTEALAREVMYLNDEMGHYHKETPRSALPGCGLGREADPGGRMMAEKTIADVVMEALPVRPVYKLDRGRVLMVSVPPMHEVRADAQRVIEAIYAAGWRIVRNDG
jgi:hypothetical protein